MRRDLPSGTVTFLFTDVEGSSRLLQKLGAEEYAEKLAEHRKVVREACTARGGVEVDTHCDAFFVAFPTASEALEAARTITDRLAPGPIALRIGVHTGTPLVTDEGYLGEDVHLAARIAASAHGGQVVCSTETRALVDGDLTDLGEHRLKDIREPVAIFQLGHRNFPPLKTISNTNLPRPASSFVGRTRELKEVLARLNSARLVTLTGPGGSGKTRLALEAASTLVPEYNAGVFWVGLAALRDPALVTETISQTLGAKDDLAEHIGDREMLLLLDNLEQVIDSAPALSALLGSCPNLTLLLTSRELLRLQGEIEYEVPPLASPEAVSLLCERSGLEATEEIAELCGRLDNLPLAVELAAARTKALSIAQILARLSQRLDLLKGGRDADPRQLTLRTTIDWSYELLSSQEQRLFCRLSIFAGGCTLEAAQEVCDANVETLEALIVKSLLRRSEDRYWMLETIREFAAEKLAEAGDADQLRRRHAEHFTALAEEAEPRLLGAGQRDWSKRLEAEHENMRAALAYARAEDEHELALRLAVALAPFWGARSHIQEGRTSIEAALSAVESLPAALVAKALNSANVFASAQGDLAAARRFAERALHLAREAGDREAEGAALTNLVAGAVTDGDLERAIALQEQARSLAAESGDEFGIAIAAVNLGRLNVLLGRLPDAERLLEESLELARKLGNDHFLAHVLRELAVLMLTENAHGEASPLLVEAITRARDIGNRHSAAYCLEAFAIEAVQRGLPLRAARLIGAAEVIRQEQGSHMDADDAAFVEKHLEEARQSLGEERFRAARTQGGSMTFDESVAYAVSFEDERAISSANKEGPV